MRLETWLRISGIKYETKAADLSQAPKGKVPYIRYEGKLMGDSTLIIEHLKRTYGKDPDEGLSSAERAVSLAFNRLAQENLYWVIIYGRWGNEANWAVYREGIAALLLPPEMPTDVKEQALAGLRKSMLDQLYGHGMGRHTAEEIYSFGIADLSAISDFLADKPFFFGERPTSVDATLFAYVANILDFPLPDPVKDHGLKLLNLPAYCKRMRGGFFPELNAA